MPRNGSGTYTLPAGNPVTTGTLIEASWANTTLSDMASEMTDSLSRSGEGGMLAPLRLADGNLSTPGLAFSNEVATGFYRSGTASMWASVAGIQITQFTSTGMVGRFAAGAVGTPSITAHGDLNTGVYFPAADKLAIVTGGTSRVIVDDSGNVGIGTIAPSKKFVVSDAGAYGMELAPNDAGGGYNRLINYDRAASLYRGVQYEAEYHIFSTGTTGNSEKFRIGVDGQLGVGGANYGTSGQVLTSGGASAAPSWTTLSLLTGVTTSTTTALGVNAGDSVTSGNYNTAIGYDAGTALTSGSSNTFLGFEAGKQITTSNWNTHIGYSAGANGANVSSNSFVGYLSGYNIGGSGNSALGHGSMQGSGPGNTAANNTAIGFQALLTVLSGGANVAVGYQAGDSITTGSWNTVIGHSSGDAITTGVANTAVGYNTLRNVTTGGTNVALGDSAYLSGNYSNSIALGYDAQVTGNNQGQIGNGNVDVYAKSFNNTSDARDKTDIQDTNLGLAFVMQLQPRMYRWDMREFYRSEKPGTDATEEEWNAWREANKLANLTPDGTHKRNRFHQGLVAQEVKAVMDSMGVDFGGFRDSEVNGGEPKMGLEYTQFIAPLIKAIQELKAEVDALKAAQGN